MAELVVDGEYIEQIDNARRELRDLISEKNCAPIMLRLACVSISRRDESESDDKLKTSIRNSHGDLKFAMDMCEDVKTKYPKLTYADLYQLAGVVAAEVSTGREISFSPGRKDSNVFTGEVSANQGLKHLPDAFYKMGMSDKEDTVAHSLVVRDPNDIGRGSGFVASSAPVEATKATTSIESLPVDMILEIFARVGPQKSCAAVCRTWCHLYRSKQRALILREKPLSSEIFPLKASYFKSEVYRSRLREIIQEPAPTPYPLTIFPLKARHFESLVSLTLDFSLADPDILVGQPTDEHLATVAADFPHLKKIQLMGCDWITSSGLAHVARECQLAYLRLRDCRHFDDEAVLAVVRASRSLQHLHISFLEVSGVGIEVLRTLTTVFAHGCPRSVALSLL